MGKRGIEHLIGALCLCLLPGLTACKQDAPADGQAPVLDMVALADFESEDAGFSQVLLKFQLLDTRSDILKYDIHTPEEHQERLQYYRAQFKEDVYLVSGADTIPCYDAHSLRDLIFVEEQYKQSWAGELESLLCRIKSSADASDSGCVDIRWQGRFRKEYRQLLSQGLEANPLPEKIPGKRGNMAKTYPRNLLERLQKRENDYLRFMYDPDAFFDNNQAERDLRMNKVKMKISGCFRSFEASKLHRLLPIFALFYLQRKNNLSMF